MQVAYCRIGGHVAWDFSQPAGVLVLPDEPKRRTLNATCTEDLAAHVRSRLPPQCVDHHATQATRSAEGLFRPARTGEQRQRLPTC